MREILFRGKSISHGMWVIGDYTEHAFNERPTICDECGWDNVDPNTVGQFTGMLDANGNKIFEGDFIQLYTDVKKTFCAVDGDIRYSRGCFFVGSYGNQLKSLNTLADFTGVMRGVIIGNIHDNPELMKTDEE